jgi:hypothetical protein
MVPVVPIGLGLELLSFLTSQRAGGNTNSESLLRQAIDFFGSRTQRSPLNQDVDKIRQLVTRVINGGTGASVPPPPATVTPPPASSAAGQATTEIVFRVRIIVERVDDAGAAKGAKTEVSAPPTAEPPPTAPAGPDDKSKQVEKSKGPGEK